ncbi:MAG: hypothetical protein Q9195_004382 [Heterodermia aff. obscurata]
MDGVNEGFQRPFEETEPRTFEKFVESVQSFLSRTNHSGTLTPAVEAIDHQNHAAESVKAEKHDSVGQDVFVPQWRVDCPKIKLEDDMDDNVEDEMVMERSIADKPRDMDWTNIKSEHDDGIPHPGVPASKVPRIGQWKEIGGYGPWTLRLYDTGMSAGDSFRSGISCWPAQISSFFYLTISVHGSKVPKWRICLKQL